MGGVIEGGVSDGREPRARILEEVEVSTAMWRPKQEGGASKARGFKQGEPVGSAAGSAGSAESLFEWRVGFDDGSSGRFDCIWMATGGELDCTLVPLLADLLSQWPIPVVRGLPALQADLSWDRECPVHVMGAFAQLQLGADALNLAGCRAGSVIVARTIRQTMKLNEQKQSKSSN